MCNKMAFGTKSEADRQIKMMFNCRHGKIGRKIRMYECPDCGLWHLSSSTNKQKREKHREWKRINRA